MHSPFRHPIATLLVATAAGPAWYWCLWLLPWTRAFMETPSAFAIGENGATVVLAFSVTTLLVAVLLRRRIARDEPTLPTAIIGLGLGAGCFLWISWLLALPARVARFGLEILVPDSGTLLGLLSASLLGLFLATILLPVTLPLACALVHLLRLVNRDPHAHVRDDVPDDVRTGWLLRSFPGPARTPGPR